MVVTYLLSLTQNNLPLYEWYLIFVYVYVYVFQSTLPIFTLSIIFDPFCKQILLLFYFGTKLLK
jgi:hypothetical protein